MGLAGSSGMSGRRRRGHRGGAFTDINVTPLVDVMLVLLIVFMVAAPLMTVGVPIDLPRTAAQPMQPEKRPVTVTVTAEGALSIDGDAVSADALAAAVAAKAGEGTSERLLVRGDAAADYGIIMGVMGALSAAGYAHIGLVTEQEPGP
jgi:biopolymer transport protein TolR